MGSMEPLPPQTKLKQLDCAPFLVGFDPQDTGISNLPEPPCNFEDKKEGLCKQPKTNIKSFLAFIELAIGKDWMLGCPAQRSCVVEENRKKEK